MKHFQTQINNPSAIAICIREDESGITIQSNIAFLTNANAISIFTIISDGYK